VTFPPAVALPWPCRGYGRRGGQVP